MVISAGSRGRRAATGPVGSPVNLAPFRDAVLSDPSPVTGARVAAAVQSSGQLLGTDGVLEAVENLTADLRGLGPLQRLALEGSGRVMAASDSLRRSVSMELRTDEFSFEDLARSMPEGVGAATWVSGGWLSVNVCSGRPASPLPSEAARHREPPDPRPRKERRMTIIIGYDGSEGARGAIEFAGEGLRLMPVLLATIWIGLRFGRPIAWVAILVTFLMVLSLPDFGLTGVTRA